MPVQAEDKASYSILQRLLKISGSKYKFHYVKMFSQEMASGLQKNRFKSHVELIAEIQPKLQALVERCENECGEFLQVRIQDDLLFDIGQAMKEMEAKPDPAPQQRKASNAAVAKKGRSRASFNLPAHLQRLVSPMGQTDHEVVHKAFTGEGDLIRFMGGLEIKPRGSIAITLDAAEFSGKTRFFFQGMEAYANAGYTSLFLSLELARESEVFARLRDQYVSKKNMQNMIHVLHEEDISSLELLLELMKYYDMIWIDSFNKLKWQQQIDNFRQELDGKAIWAIFQRTQDDLMRGGAGTKFDADVVMRMVVDPDYTKSFVYHHKNRYQTEFSTGEGGIRYSIANQKILENEPAVSHEV